MKAKESFINYIHPSASRKQFAKTFDSTNI